MKKRRILLALIMLIISGISLTTATYAWFTANSTVKVEDMNVKATASGGIQISADAKSWSDQVSIAQLKAIATNIVPDTTTTAATSLMPLTTVGTNNGTGAFDFYLGTLDNAGSQVKLTKVDESESTNLLAFDLYFYLATTQTVYFNSNTSVGTDNHNLQYAMRIGFLYQGYDPTATPDTALDLAEGDSNDQIIWEPYSNKHTSYVIAQDKAEDGTTYTTLGGKQSTGENYVDTDASAYFESVETVKTTDQQSYPDSEKVSWEFKAGINKMRVYVWIEGQDVDCEDTASLGDGLKISLGFTIKDPKTVE